MLIFIWVSIYLFLLILFLLGDRDFPVCSCLAVWKVVCGLEEVADIVPLVLTKVQKVQYTLHKLL